MHKHTYTFWDTLLHMHISDTFTQTHIHMLRNTCTDTHTHFETNSYKHTYKCWDKFARTYIHTLIQICSNAIHMLIQICKTQIYGHTDTLELTNIHMFKTKLESKRNKYSNFVELKYGLHFMFCLFLNVYFLYSTFILFNLFTSTFWRKMF